MGPVLQAIGIVAQIAGTVGQAQAQQREVEERKNLNKLQARRERRQVIRRGVVARAEARAGAQSQGAFGSGLSGGVGSIASQIGGTLGHATQASAIGSNISSAQSDQAKFQGIAGLGTGLFNLGGAISDLASG